MTGTTGAPDSDRSALAVPPGARSGEALPNSTPRPDGIRAQPPKPSIEVRLLAGRLLPLKIARGARADFSLDVVLISLSWRIQASVYEAD